ncbi:hypothetical protein [Methanomethylophilus alvi]
MNAILINTMKGLLLFSAGVFLALSVLTVAGVVLILLNGGVV